MDKRGTGREPLVVVESVFAKGRSVFESSSDFEYVVSPPDEAALSARIRSAGARYAVVSTQRYTGELYETLPSGGVIARFGVGHDGIDKAAATRRGILVTNTPGVLEDSVAEHAVLMMGCLARRIADAGRRLRDGEWRPLVGSELSGKRLLVVGCGPIGCRTARIAARGFGMRVSGCDVVPLDAAALKTEFGIDELRSDLDTALGQADFVSLHVPATPATRHFVNRGLLSRMKRGAILVNTARGSVIDEAALYDALEGGLIAGAALDVFETEPYAPAAPGKDLRTLDIVLMTPHMASGTAEACSRMAGRCLDNLIAARDGNRRAMDIVNREVLEP